MDGFESDELGVYIPGHGRYTTTIKGMDATLLKYQNAMSHPEQLKNAIVTRWLEDGILSCRCGAERILNSLTECLIVLAELDGHGV